MIVLDTNVLSELLRPQPAARVVAWVDAQPTGQLALTAVTVGELLYGVARLPPGRRRRQLGEAVLAVLREDFGDRILAFDGPAAEEYAQIVAERDEAGRPIGHADAQIAAVCRRDSATLATRNRKDFAGTGVDVVDPWRST